MEITSTNNDLVKETAKIQQKNTVILQGNFYLKGLRRLKKRTG